jgi:hypothetical protein
VEDKEKPKRLQGFVDGLIADRWETLRPMTQQEIKATIVLTMPIDEASVKIRTGGPVDDDEDYELPIWAGVVPVKQVLGDPVPNDKNLPGIDVPSHVQRFTLD